MTASRKPNSCDSAESATVWQPHNPDTPRDSRQADHEATRNSPELLKRRQGSRHNLCRQPHAPMLYRAYLAVMRMPRGHERSCNRRYPTKRCPVEQSSNKAKMVRSTSTQIECSFVLARPDTFISKARQHFATTHQSNGILVRLGAQGARDNGDGTLNGAMRKDSSKPIRKAIQSRALERTSPKSGRRMRR